MTRKSRNVVEPQARTRSPNALDFEPHSPRSSICTLRLAASLGRGGAHVLEPSCLQGRLPPSALPPSVIQIPRAGADWPILGQVPDPAPVGCLGDEIMSQDHDGSFRNHLDGMGRRAGEES